MEAISKVTQFQDYDGRKTATYRKVPHLTGKAEKKKSG